MEPSPPSSSRGWEEEHPLPLLSSLFSKTETAWTGANCYIHPIRLIAELRLLLGEGGGEELIPPDNYYPRELRQIRLLPPQYLIFEHGNFFIFLILLILFRIIRIIRYLDGKYVIRFLLSPLLFKFYPRISKFLLLYFINFQLEVSIFFEPECSKNCICWIWILRYIRSLLLILLEVNGRYKQIRFPLIVSTNIEISLSFLLILIRIILHFDKHITRFLLLYRFY